MPNEKHLELVQQVIARMAGNSFLLKGWSVTLTAGLFALAAKDSDPRFVLIAILPAFAFWVLDSYYLRQEKLFRELYDVLRTSSEDHQFSMDRTLVPEDRQPSIPRIMFSASVFGLHGVLLIVTATILVYLAL